MQADATNPQKIMYFLAVFVGALLLIPHFTHAMGEMADKMCNPVDVDCPCGKVKDDKGQCTKSGENFHDCPLYCTDNTNGYISKGHCILPNKCHCDIANGKPCDDKAKQGEGGKPPEMPKPPQGGGGSGGGQPQSGNPCDANVDKASGIQRSVATSSWGGPDGGASPCGPSGSNGFGDYYNVPTDANAFKQEMGSSTSGGNTDTSLEHYIDELRGYFSGDKSSFGTSTSANNGDPALLFGSILRELNQNLSNVAHMTPPENQQKGDGNGSSVQGGTNTGAYYSESLATGFNPPPSGMTEPNLLQNFWQRIKSWLGF